VGASRYEDLLGAGSPLAAGLAGFRVRPGQLRLAEAIGETLTDGGLLIAEAATGIGKSLAYLVPAATTERRVVVTTATRALQGQLLHDDLPLARLATGRSLSATVVKGRANYVCRLQRALARERIPEAALGELAQLEDWLVTTRTGDRDELATVPSEVVWRELAVGPDRCRGGRCPEREGCFAERVREEAQRSDVVLVNHALYLADLALRVARGGEPAILPEHDLLIVDEAHAFEDAAAEALGARVSGPALQRFTRDVENACDAAVEPIPRGDLGRLAMHAERLFMALPEGRRVRLDESTLRALPLDAADGMRDALAAIAATIRDFGDEAELLARSAERQALALEAILDPDHDETVVWSQREPRSGVELHAAPIAVGSLLREHLWDRLDAAILVSATLADAEGLGGATRRLGLEGARTLIEPSPFDVEEQARLYVARDLDAGGRAGIDPALLADRIAELVTASGGRALILISSLWRLERVYEHLQGRLEVPLLRQGGASRDVLLRRFREEETSVLLGSMSFWQGVDIPGRALELVVMDRLPFAPPDDPLTAARSERSARAGGDGFREVQLPRAALLLKQGFGRLLRSEDDRGVVAVLDGRLVTRSYGAYLRGSLPAVPLLERVDEVAAFLQREAN